ncbi:hypothetical protein F4777DRAFT_577762 [Nemania sp. FL0916]|nr:hypothetical protein F4777DRAFT_577762 [Nemania sp. FL0916]
MIENRRRLDNIVEQTSERLDACVYDGRCGQKRVRSEEPEDYMSGALLTSSKAIKVTEKPFNVVVARYASSGYRQTPVPAPQPWRRLGLLSPAGDGPPRTPNKTSDRRSLQATSSSETERERFSPCQTQASKFSKPDSSPLSRLARRKSNS